MRKCRHPVCIAVRLSQWTSPQPYVQANSALKEGLHVHNAQHLPADSCMRAGLAIKHSFATLAAAPENMLHEMRLHGRGLGQMRATNIPTAPRHISSIPCLSSRPLQATFELQLRGLARHMRSIMRLGAINNEVSSPGGRLGVAWAWAFSACIGTSTFIGHLQASNVAMVCAAHFTPLQELHTPLP